MSKVVIEGLAENRGKWVALDYANRRVVLSAATRPALMAELKRLGHVGGVVMQVPDVDEPSLVGFVQNWPAHGFGAVLGRRSFFDQWTVTFFGANRVFGVAPNESA